MTRVTEAKGPAWVTVVFRCLPTSPPRCCEGPGHMPALSPQSPWPRVPAWRASLNPGFPQATGAGVWGAQAGALAWRLSRLEMGPPQSPQCSKRWSCQNPLEKPWWGLPELLRWGSKWSGLPRHTQLAVPTGLCFTTLSVQSDPVPIRVPSFLSGT